MNHWPVAEIKKTQGNSREKNCDVNRWSSVQINEKFIHEDQWSNVRGIYFCNAEVSCLWQLI